MRLFHKHSQGQDLATMPASQSVFEASQLMTEKSIGAILIMDGDSLEGIFTERDLLNRVVSKGLDPKKISISQVMTPHVVTVDVNDTLESCYEKMQETRARHVPIVDGGRVIGIVTMRNLLEWLWREIQDENNHLKQYIQQS